MVAALILPIESRADHRLLVEPSLQVNEVNDDNLNLSVDEPMRDRIHRITPALSLRLDSPRWRVRGTYSIDSEHYVNHSTLDSNRAREQAAVGIMYQAGPRLRLSLESSHVDTNTLADLNVDTRLAASRTRGRRLSVDPSAMFRISSRLTATAAASSVTTNVVNGSRLRAQNQRLGLERRVTPRDFLTVGYEHSHLVFDGPNSQTVNTHAVLAGWRRDLGLHDQLILQAGPRITDRSRLVDFSASLTHRWSLSSIGLSFLRNQTTVVGHAGAVDTKSLQAHYTFAPNRRISAHLDPAVLRNTGYQLQATVARVTIGARCAISSLLDAEATYNRDLQNGAMDSLRPNAKLSRSTLSVGFTTRWNKRDTMR